MRQVKEVATFGILGALMYAAKVLVEFLPNVHLLGTLIVAVTLVYRTKALYPIYTFVFLTGLLSGFSTWWIPYLYIWTVLWASTMLLPRKMPSRVRPIVYMLVCALHGFAFGTLYAPVQAVLYGLDFRGMLAWIVAGLPWDVVHGISNFCFGIMILPLVSLLKLADKPGTPA